MKVMKTIPCPQTGGSKSVHACCVLDRYRRCRKKCRSLANYLKEHPEIKNEAESYVKKTRQDSTGWLFKTLQHANEGLPNTNPELQCTHSGCEFVAKSKRGLKVHMTRTHGVKKRVA